FFGDARLEMVTKADDDERGAGGDAPCANQSATCGDGSSISGGRVKSLIEHPPGESLHDGTRPAKIDLAIVQREIEAPGKSGLLLEGLTQGAWSLCFADGDVESTLANGFERYAGNRHCVA